jgi:hypothetical protein
MPVIYPEGDGLVGGDQVPEEDAAPDGVGGGARGDVREWPIHASSGSGISTTTHPG